MPELQVSKGQEEAMDLMGVAGVSRVVVVGAVLAGAAVVIVLARVLARRASRGDRTLVNLNGHE